VQVTFPDGSTADLIQKAYPLSNFIAAGFAGSVRIGFQLLQSLSDFLRIPQEALETQAWDPKWVSENWAPIAKSVFDGAPAVERKAPGTSILMVGASPTESCGLGAKVYFTRFAAPDFRPCIMRRAIKVCSIGSGAKTREYHQSLKPLFRHTSGILQGEVMNPGGWARGLDFSVSHRLAIYPRHGISRHMHILIVRRGDIVVETNDESIYPPNGSVEEVRMPRVAQGYEEFRTLAKGFGHSATGRDLLEPMFGQDRCSVLVVCSLEGVS
jgi:hypothetical protein